MLEVPSSGRDRLDRIFGLIASCGASIHDLSRVSLSGASRVPRFNMPFELGLAYALSRQGDHSFFAFEEKPYRLQASLSDLNGHDPHIHEGTQIGILRCTLDCFGTGGSIPALSSLRGLTRRLSQAVTALESESGVNHPFHPSLFRRSVNAAVDLAQDEGLLI